MTESTTIAPGDYLCHPCTRPGEKTKVGPGIWLCARGCGRRTARVLVAGPPPADEKPPMRRVTVRG